jgi:SagB-type dehydrogenase family enzyme
MIRKGLHHSILSLRPSHETVPIFEHNLPRAVGRRPARYRWAACAVTIVLCALKVTALPPKPPEVIGGEQSDRSIQANPTAAQEVKPIKLNPPNKKRGLPLMEALSLRASTWNWSEKNLLLQDLSDLLWAANGINRPESKKRTAPSAMNAQEVDIYVFLKDGAYLYDASQHLLNPVTSADHRAAIDDMPPGGEPTALLILVSDISRFKLGSQEVKLQWAALDSGIISQNISLFCAATGLGSRPRTDMNKDLIKRVLKLKDTQLPILNHAVGYPKKTP